VKFNKLADNVPPARCYRGIFISEKLKRVKLIKELGFLVTDKNGVSKMPEAPFSIKEVKVLRTEGEKKYSFIIFGSNGEMIKSNIVTYKVLPDLEERKNGDEDEIKKNLTPEEEEGENDLLAGDD
jgi:hypothetical protein